MTPRAQRIAIAKACGWTKADHYTEGFGGGRCLETGRKDKQGMFFRKLPDYLNDLNAMYEAESTLTTRQIPVFEDELFSVCELPHAGTLWIAIHATAAQRAEAFLRTLGLWIEQQKGQP